MEEKLFPGKEVPWVPTKRGISMNDFAFEAQILLNNIGSQVSPCAHMTMVPDFQARMVACILDNISLNSCQLVVSNIKFFKNHSGKLLLFPSSITELHKRARMEVYHKDT